MALGADDPLLFLSRLDDQYRIAREVHGLDDDALADLARSSIRASLASERSKREMLADVDAWLAHARPPARRVSRPREVARVALARAWAADYAFAARGLARAAGGWVRRSHPGAFRVTAGPSPGAPVLLLPGIYESWRFLEPLAAHLHAAGHPVHVVTALGLNGRDALDGAERAARYLQAADLRDVVVVAHSKGGLIGKALMLREARGPRRPRAPGARDGRGGHPVVGVELRGVLPAGLGGAPPVAARQGAAGPGPGAGRGRAHRRDRARLGPAHPVRLPAGRRASQRRGARHRALPGARRPRRARGGRPRRRGAGRV